MRWMRTVCNGELTSLVETPDAAVTETRTKTLENDFNGKDDP